MQTYENIEVILVDDGSPDGCSVLCDRFSAQDVRVRVMHKENGGLVSARKVGLCLSKGAYVAYVDGDDWIDADLYEKMMNIVLCDDADVVCFGVVKENADELFALLNAVKRGLYNTRSALESLYGMMLDRGNYGHFGVLPFLHAKIFKREILAPAQEAVDEGIVVGEDVACTYPCLLRANSVAISDVCGYHYRMREDSMSAPDAATEEKAYERMLLLRDYLDWQFSASPYREMLVSQNRRYFIWGLLLKFPQKAFDAATGCSLVYDNLYIGERVAVYGAGGFGKDIAFGFTRSGVCELVTWVDRDFSDPQKARRGVMAPHTLQSVSYYDKVLLASVHENLLQEMEQTLTDMDIPETKIARPKLDVIHGRCAIGVTT
jgi:glycosyltransferase involved in cell wall biosynthesis